MAKSIFESIDESYGALPAASTDSATNLRNALKDTLGDPFITQRAMSQADAELAKNVPTSIVAGTSGFFGSIS